MYKISALELSYYYGLISRIRCIMKEKRVFWKGKYIPMFLEQEQIDAMLNELAGATRCMNKRLKTENQINEQQI